MTLERLARWLGPRYVFVEGYGGSAQIFDGQTYYALDDDQLLGAILRRAAEFYASVYLCMENDAHGLRWEMRVCHDYGPPLTCKEGPNPLSAALAAVEELCKETT